MPDPATRATAVARGTTCPNPADHDEPADSDVVFDMVTRLVARGYRVRVSIDMPDGNSMTMTGEPDGPLW